MNQLISETSPYLLQHANNPVYWKAWNKDSLALAQKNNKLIIISIGYSACHLPVKSVQEALKLLK